MRTRGKKGISLIILVITIIIMIILAASVILSLSGSDIIGKANKAKMDNEVATNREKEIIKLTEYELKKARGDDVGTVKSYMETQFPDHLANEEGKIVATKHTEGAGVNEKIVPIPLGFTKSTVSTEDEIDEGLVIKDSEGNEFVWVPVEVEAGQTFDDVFVRTTAYNGTISDPGNYYKESYRPGGYTGEYDEYNAMRDSVETYGGFYIGRYEAGSKIKRTGSGDGTTKIVVKKNVYPYNHVGWGMAMNEIEEEVITYASRNQGYGAVRLSKDMYANSLSVVSTLCYGVQWDAALKFIYKTDNSYPINSANKGWYTGVSGNSDHKTGIDIGNSTNKLNNIYDMAGNVSEWTMESFYSDKRVLRGGNYTGQGSFAAAYDRNGVATPRTTYEQYGFRIALYIK